MGAEPPNEHPLAGAQRGVLHGKEQQPCQCHEPQKHTQPHRFPRKGSHYQREHRSVVVDVEVFGIFGIERLAVYGVPEHVAEHQEVVVVAVAQLRHCHQRKQCPQPEDCGVAMEERLRKQRLYFLQHDCKVTIKCAKSKIDFDFPSASRLCNLVFCTFVF